MAHFGDLRFDLRFEPQDLRFEPKDLQFDLRFETKDLNLLWKRLGFATSDSIWDLPMTAAVASTILESLPRNLNYL